MKTVWDPNKAEKNYNKHKIRFSDAESVLFDPCALTIEDTASEGKQRHVTVGMDSPDRILTAVFTYRGNAIRLISARRANKSDKPLDENTLRRVIREEFKLAEHTAMA